MNTISCSPLDRQGRNAFGSAHIAEATRTSLKISSSAEISLLTADDDKVTISAGASLHAQHPTYDFSGACKVKRWTRMARSLKS